jgi:hypothetical protein
MATSLDIYGSADAPGVLDTVANDLALPSKRDKINSKACQSDPGGKLILTLAFQSHRNTAVL